MWYNFKNKEDAQSVIDSINNDLGLPKKEDIYKGQPKHIDGTSETYTKAVEHDGGFAIIKDSVTVNYCQEAEEIDELNSDTLII